MPRSQSYPPDLLPILSRGKHRSARKGACFMELASFLAGEKWSDHPACTHPLLAEVARLVNDHTADANRPALGRLIPSVIGLTTEDPRVDARITLRAARAALPIVSAERQNVMAVAILTADRVLSLIDGRPLDQLEVDSLRALDTAPHATKWAYGFTQGAGISIERFRRHAAPDAVRCAVQGIAHACVAEPDALLRELLADAIDVCVAAGPAQARQEVDHAAWRAACALTSAR